EEGGRDGGSGGEGEKNDEEAAAIGEEEAANEAAEHGAICGLRRHSYSPRRIGAGSQRVARRRGRALPSSVTRMARARTTPRTRNEGSGGTPKIFVATMRA